MLGMRPSVFTLAREEGARKKASLADSHGSVAMGELRFNLDVATHPANLATQFSNPSPIVIEKISAEKNAAAEDLLNHSCSSVPFSVVSEERLNLAIQLAKRDVKRMRLGGKLEGKLRAQPPGQWSPQVSQGTQSSSPDKAKSRTRVKKEQMPYNASKHQVTKSGALVYVYTPDKNRMNTGVSDSPPTHDPGPGPILKKTVDRNEQEIRRLQKELHTYMRKIEELAKKDRIEEALDPFEETRGQIRQQERAARSARMLYVLRQQVKEIQEDLEMLSVHKIKHTKKSRTMSRLAAVHRGAIRTLQLFVTQLSEQGEQEIPFVYKELGQLIRQLSLCTAKLETASDAAASSLTISILQQVEDLDLLLEEKLSCQARKVSPKPAASVSPQSRKNIRRMRSPVREGRGPPPVLKQKEPLATNLNCVNRRLVVDIPPESLSAATQTEPEPALESSSPERQAALRSALESMIQAGRLKGLPRTGVGQKRNKDVVIPQRSKAFRQPRRADSSRPAHFQEKTVAFKLKENQPVVRDKRTPWVPPNPTSPPASPKRGIRNIKGSPSRICHEINVLKENEDIATKEESRLAWLESETAKRMQQLDDLYRKEITNLQSLRNDVQAAKRLADEDFSHSIVSRRPVKTREAILPRNEREESLWESGSYDGDENGQIFQQDDNDLAAMIERMEEIEKHHEAVRQRFHTVVYSDPDFWAQEEKERLQSNTDQRPSSPYPIRITKPAGQREPEVEILLEEPVEGDSFQINKEELSRSSPHHFIRRPESQDKGLLPISVPHKMLQSIHSYTERFDRHLRLTSHEEVGAFNPWHVSESFAEELLNEALGEVAAELQDLCEGYAEAVFTSEFMEPTENND
ncbi:protein moonraker [Gastrophryne carolinensis]